VEITEKAHQHLAAIDPELAVSTEQVLAPLTVPERRALRDLLAKLLGADAPPRAKRK
jgi:hypothetical protein